MRLLSRGFLVMGLGLASLGAVTAYLGVVLLGSVLISIALVMITLYLFIRFWPEEEASPVLERASAPRQAASPRAMVSVVRADGPPKHRVVMALRDLVRKEGQIRLSPQGAERFARTIRFILRSEE